MGKGTCRKRKAIGKKKVDGDNEEREKAKRDYADKDEDVEEHVNIMIDVEEEEEEDNYQENYEDEWQLASQYLTNEKNPFFFTRPRSDKHRQLYVPTEVIKDFNLELPSEMFLKDQHGRKWPGRVYKWRDGRTWITGWKQLCKWNNVTPRHTCICEILEGTAYLQVYIVRGGSERKS